MYRILLSLFYLLSEEAHEILLLIFAIVFIFKSFFLRLPIQTYR